jgi:hypothetical protein
MDDMAPARLTADLDLVTGRERHGLIQVTVAEHGLCIQHGLAPKTTCLVQRVCGAARATLGETSFGREDRRDPAGYGDLRFAEGTEDLHCFAHLAGEWIHGRHLISCRLGSSQATHHMLAGTGRLLKGNGSDTMAISAPRVRRSATKPA